jgi:hypothetical protein
MMPAMARGDGGTTWVHRRTSGLPLIVELRRRNPAITYDGLWSPRTRGRRNLNPWR